MPTLWGRPRFLYALLVVPLLMGAKDGKGCCGRKDVDTDTTVVTGPDVEKAIQVVSIDPSAVGPDEAFEARIFGAAFASGATVTIGGATASNVVVVDANTITASVAGQPVGTYDVTVSNSDGSSALLRRGLTVRGATVDECRHVVLTFDFDSANLSVSSRSELDRKMPCFQASPGKINVAGHCDERGTTEYNLALGERRAAAVRDFLVGQGVPAARLNTISFGEERPADPSSSESAWQKNRRAEFVSAG